MPFLKMNFIRHCIQLNRYQRLNCNEINLKIESFNKLTFYLSYSNAASRTVHALTGFINSLSVHILDLKDHLTGCHDEWRQHSNNSF